MIPAAGREATVRLGSGLLGAGCVVWAAAPLIPGGYLNLALFLASAGVAAGVLRLALAATPVPEDTYLLTAATRFWLRFLEILRLVPWEEGTLVAILWLEVLHPARPWHTAVLGAALIAYLLATHLAESGASPGALRSQIRVLAVGAGVLALGAAAGMVPAAGQGAGPALLRLVAAGALIAAAGLVLPYVVRGEARTPGSVGRAGGDGLPFLLDMAEGPDGQGDGPGDDEDADEHGHDGYITYVGRTDDVFKASDYRISPFELESVLIEHEAVAEAAVVPSPELAQSIMAFRRERVAPYKRIRRVEFGDLPKMISGKIRRVELRGQETSRAASPRGGRPVLS